MNTVRIEIHGVDEVVALHTGQLATIARPRGVRLTCVSGILWLTQGDSAKDLVLYTGETLVFDRRAPVYLYALKAGEARIEASQPEPSLWARLARLAAEWMPRPVRAAA
jgi:hypothetical protein